MRDGVMRRRRTRNVPMVYRPTKKDESPSNRLLSTCWMPSRIECPMPPAKRPPSMLYRVGDPVEVRDADPPIMATVATVTSNLVRVTYHDAAGHRVHRWVAADVVRQATAPDAMKHV